MNLHKITPNILFLLILFGLCFGIPKIYAAGPVLAPPPPQSELDRLRNLGRQNELKYGSGGTTPAPIRRSTPIPTITPTITSTPTAQITQSPTSEEMPSYADDVRERSQRDFWAKWRHWIKQFILFLFPPPMPNLNMPVVSKQATPTLTSTPTTKSMPSGQTPQELWKKGFNIWVTAKDPDRSSAYYKQALAIDPNYVPALASYGYMQGAFFNKFTEGEAMIKKAMELDPTWAYAPYNLGLLYEISNRHSDGLYWLQYTVDHFPNHPDIGWFREHLDAAKAQ